MLVFDCDDEKDLSVAAIRAMDEDVPEPTGGMSVFLGKLFRISFLPACGVMQDGMRFQITDVWF